MNFIKKINKLRRHKLKEVLEHCTNPVNRCEILDAEPEAELEL
jgi:hypothetical protein